MGHPNDRLRSPEVNCGFQLYYSRLWSPWVILMVDCALLKSTAVFSHTGEKIPQPLPIPVRLSVLTQLRDQGVVVLDQSLGWWYH